MYSVCILLCSSPKKKKSCDIANLKKKKQNTVICIPHKPIFHLKENIEYISNVETMVLGPQPFTILGKMLAHVDFDGGNTSEKS